MEKCADRGPGMCDNLLHDWNSYIVSMIKERMTTARHADSDSPRGFSVTFDKERATEARMEDWPDMIL